MSRRFSAVYATVCLLVTMFGMLACVFFAWSNGTGATVEAVVGLILGVILVPTVHEVGHIVFANRKQMRCVYLKCFCFEMKEQQGKMRFRLTSPFAAEQTQVLPIKSGDMANRLSAFAVGGVVFGGVFALIALALALATTLFFTTSYGLWLIFIYAAYLFVLNVVPCQYAGGKTDMLVYLGLKRGYDSEKVMISAMEIYGQLYEGKRFSEIDKKWYFDLPQLAEDEPVYAVILDLRYRYYLDQENFDGAADALNRLASAGAYLLGNEAEKVAAELVYLHCLNGDLERANECAKLCKDYLQSDELAPKRILASYSALTGNIQAVETLRSQAQTLLASEQIAGVGKLEEKLLNRINTNER